MYSTDLKNLKKSLSDLENSLSDAEFSLSEAESEIIKCRRQIDNADLPSIDEIDENYLFEVKTLSDHFKYQLLKEVFDKYTLEDIQQILNWQQGKGIQIKL